MDAVTLSAVRAAAADQAGQTARIQAAEQVQAVQAQIDAFFPSKGAIPVGVAAEDSAALTIGADGTTLIADAAEPTGMKWGHRPLTVPVHLGTAALTWTAMPAAATLLLGTHTHVRKVDLTNYRQCRLVVNKQSVAGFAGSLLEVKFATSFATSAAGYSQIGSSAVTVAVDVADVVQVSSWIDLTASAKADVFVAIVGSGGNGVVNPTFGSIEIQLR